LLINIQWIWKETFESNNYIFCVAHFSESFHFCVCVKDMFLNYYKLCSMFLFLFFIILFLHQQPNISTNPSMLCYSVQGPIIWGMENETNSNRSNCIMTITKWLFEMRLIWTPCIRSVRIRKDISRCWICI